MRKFLAAVAALDSLSQVAVVCLLLGWFFTDTLVASWGSLQHGVRFFHFAVLIHDPSLLFFRIPVGLPTLLFGVLCLACVAAPLLPRLYPRPWLALANLAPLLLLLVCGWLLYQRTAGDLIPASATPESVTGKVVGLANRLLNKGSAVVSRHVAVGLGGYLGTLACGVLAVQGIRQLRRSTPRDTRAVAEPRSG